MKIEGKVAKILDKKTIVANIGEKDGVESGMKFRIYEPGERIRDPDTKEVIGRAPDITKGTVVARDVKENMTVMETERTVVEKDPLNFNFARALKRRPQIIQSELNTEEEVPEDRSKIREGDHVQFTEEENGEVNQKPQDTEDEADATSGDSDEEALDW